MQPTGSDILLVRAGEERFAIERSRTLGALSATAVEPLRRAPNGVAGLIDAGAGRVPVVDLHWRLGIPAPIRISNGIVVLLREPPAGLLVSAVEGVTNVDLSPSALLLSFGHFGYVRAILPLADGPVALLEPAALVPQSVLRAVSA